MSHLSSETLVFIVGGQSNASGRGDLVDLPAGFNNPDPYIRMFGNDFVYRPATESVDSNTNQVHAVSSDPSTVGFGLSFAKKVKRFRKESILLVPCAMGGTRVTGIENAFKWNIEPKTTHYLTSRLFGSMLMRTGLAGLRGKLAGLLWYQGETDAQDIAAPPIFAESTQAIWTRFREELNAPKLPIISVRLHPTNPNAGLYVAWDDIRTAQLTLDSSTQVVLGEHDDSQGRRVRTAVILGVTYPYYGDNYPPGGAWPTFDVWLDRLLVSLSLSPNQVVVDSSGALKPDLVHIATSAQLSLGERMADAWLAMNY